MGVDSCSHVEHDQIVDDGGSVLTHDMHVNFHGDLRPAFDSENGFDAISRVITAA